MMNLRHLSIHSVEALEALGKKGALEITSKPVLQRICIKSLELSATKEVVWFKMKRGGQCQQILFTLMVMICI